MQAKDWNLKDFMKNLNHIRSFLIFGNDQGLIRQKSNYILNEIKKMVPNNIEILEYSDQVHDSIEEFLYEKVYQKSMFNEISVLKIFLESAKINKNIIDFFNTINYEKSNIIIVETGMLRTDSALVKLFKADTNRLLAIGCYNSSGDSRNIESSIRNFAAQYNLSLDMESVLYLADNLGNDSMVTKKEIEKLAIFANGKDLKKTDLVNFASDNSYLAINMICDSIYIQNLPNILKLTEKAIENNNYIVIIRALMSHFSMLLYSKVLGISDVKQIKPFLHFSRHSNVKKQLKIIPIDRLKIILMSLNKLELDCKKDASIANILLKKYFFRIYKNSKLVVEGTNNLL